MSQVVKDVMTGNPQVVSTSSTARQAAQIMRDKDIGAVLVVDGSGRVQGILTDRDIVVRGVVTGADPDATQVSQLFTADPATVGPNDSIDQVVARMRSHSVRRLPVVSDGVPLGIVSLGDVAIDQDPDSTLGRISSAPPSGTGPTARKARVRRAVALAASSIPVAVVGAGAAMVIERVSRRKPKRSVKLAAKRLRRVGKQMRRTQDRIGAESVNKAADYAARASKEIRKRGDKARRQAEKVARKVEKRADGTLRDAAELVGSRR